MGGRGRSWAALCFILSMGTAPVAEVRAERFSFVYAEGDRYRVLSTVREDVYVDRVLTRRAEILNRIAVTVTAVSNGVGTHEAVFQTSETGSAVSGADSAFQWEREYRSVFDRDATGRYAIGREYWMPVVRNVPVFPEGDIEEGAEWTFDGEEVHDFRDGLGISEPYRIPFTAKYKYLGERSRNGASYPTFSVSYRIFDEPPTEAARSSGSGLRPLRIMGASDQIVYWDRTLGQATAYEETFRMIFELSNGRTMEFRGSAGAETVESAPMNRGRLADEIAQDIARMGIADTLVKVTEDGVAISLEDVQFRADSADLMPGEVDKLKRIGEILARYPDRDILVGGHTALAGTEEGRRRLSEERALSVADYLIGIGVRSRDRVVVRGYGATKPVADNSNEVGKKRNRRVELTLLEN